MKKLCVWQLLVLMCLAAIPAGRSLSVVLEHDTWWHLAVGRWVFDHGTVPETDPFSRMSHEQPTPWMAYSWLFEVWLIKLHDLFGLQGMYAARAMLVGLSTGVLLAFLVRRGGVTAASIAVGVLAMIIMTMLCRERPWHCTIAFTAATVWAVQGLRDGMPLARAAWLPVMFALWANLHIQFVLGWAVLGLACLFPGRASRGGLIALAAACTAATACNPYHARLVEVICEYATQAAPLNLVEELAPPEWDKPATLAAAMLFLIGGLLAASRRPLDPFDFALLLLAAVMGLRMRRDLWFVAVAAIAMLRPPQHVSWRAAWTAGLAAFLVCCGSMAAWIAWRGHSFDFHAAQKIRYPVEGVRIISDAALPGPILNEFDWGGYLIWHLPSHPVSVDNRTNLYGSALLNRSHTTWDAEGWRDDPNFHAAAIVIAPKSRKLTEVLRDEADWTVIHECEVGVIFARKSALSGRTRHLPVE